MKVPPRSELKNRKNNWTVGIAGGQLSGSYMTFADELGQVLDNGDELRIVPILVGPVAEIRAVAKAKGIDLGKTEIVDAADSHDAARKAVELVRSGKAELLMKGSLHSDEILAAVVSKDGGLRTGRWSGCSTAALTATAFSTITGTVIFTPHPLQRADRPANSSRT